MSNKGIKILKSENYSFNSIKSEWYKGKKPMSEEDVLIHLIQFAKSQNIHNAGEWAESELKSAKLSPEITSREFIQAHIRRNRNRRTAGKYIFAEWCKATGIEIKGTIEEFTRANSLLVSRFYNEISEAGYHIRKQARVIGRVLRSVFLGLELVDAEADPQHSESGAEQKPQRDNLTNAKIEGLRRYNTFMSNLFKT